MPARDTLRKSLTDVAARFGYTLEAESFEDAVRFRLVKGGLPFDIWLRRGNDPSQAFRQTTRFKVGHQNDAPDPDGYRLLSAFVEGLSKWENTLSEDAPAELFSPPPQPSAPSPRSVAPADPSLVPLHSEWLPERETALAQWCHAQELDRPQHVLLINGTRGPQFFPSILDFFLTWERTTTNLKVTASSWFEDTFALHSHVRRIAPEDISAASAEELNAFDLILMVGVSDSTPQLMSKPGLRSKLVVLDLAFYHQLLESLPGYIAGGAAPPVGELQRDRSTQVNRAVIYSCQTAQKVQQDVSGLCAPARVEWRWVNYIPIGFTYTKYYRAERSLYDVAFLGSVGRDYSHVEPESLRGRRLLFVGNPERSPELLPLRDSGDLTVVSGANDAEYVRLLALSRCVVLPMRANVQNSLMSLVDIVASGKPLITARHPGVARLADDGLPAVFYDGTPADLSRKTIALLDDPAQLADLETRMLSFGREHMDIYKVLQMITREQLGSSVR